MTKSLWHSATEQLGGHFDWTATLAASDLAASDQNFGYRTEGSPSKVTVTNATQEVTVTRASLREYAALQRARYLRAPRAEKHALLNEVVAVASLHRKAAIRLLRRPPRPPGSRPRSGRPRRYGPAVAAAAQLLSEATGHIGPHRWHPFLPELLDRLTRSEIGRASCRERV